MGHPTPRAASRRGRGLCLGAALALGLAPRLAAAQALDPDAPVPPGSKSTILDLQSRTEELRYRTEPVAGAIEALEVKESATEIRIGLAADVLFDFEDVPLK